MGIRNIISLYSQRSLNTLNKGDFMRIKELCEESMEVLGKVDPGYPLWKAETLKDLSTAMMNLARYDGNKKLYFLNISPTGHNLRWVRSAGPSSWSRSARA